jgi:hypothetical protein
MDSSLIQVRGILVEDDANYDEPNELMNMNRSHRASIVS